ncbi:FAD-dependent oxidoreductase [Verrucomicrobiota bacterium]
MDSSYDVIVFGGGTAGAIAGIQAGRAGAKTLLVEKNGMLGGTVTVAGINAPAHFWAWGEQVIAGIPWELTRRTYEITGQPLPDGKCSKDNGRPKHIWVDRAIFAAVCDEAAVDAGVELLFHAMPAAVRRENGRWSVDVCTKSGIRTADAKVLIDTTGDANIVELAGLEVTRHETVQPATLVMKLGNYDLDKLDMDALNAASEKAIETGEIVSTDIGWRNNGPAQFLRGRGLNSNHFRVKSAETSEGRSQAEIEGRRSMLRMYKFLKAQPGLEDLYIEWVAPECGIRETVMIKGKTTMTGEDYIAGKLYDDAVCYSFYPVDIHLNDGEGIDFRPLAQNTLPTIPRGAMLPADSSCLLVAGRCIAGDRIAQSATRVEAPCMAMGQAAGAMAALSAKTGTDPADLPMDSIHALLGEHGAVIPGDVKL